MPSRLITLCLAFALLTPRAAVAEGTESPPAELYYSLRLPMDGGSIDAGKLLGSLIAQVGIDASVLTDLIDAKIDVSKTTGRVTLKAIETATRGIVAFERDRGENPALVIKVNRAALRRERTAFNNKIMRLVQAWYPQAADKINGRHGLFLHSAKPDARPAPLGEQKLPAHVVVLVHGLDEPGDVWDTLAPALIKDGHAVCEFRYPNDQPVVRSAKTLAEGLALVKAAGAKEVTLIGHSMGGLVCRETLTGSDGYYGSAAGAGVPEKLPAVRRLIMAGTPNQGAALALLQPAGDVRETLIRAFSGDRLLFGSFFDGAGEAGDDLQPGSTFLIKLNARPMPKDVPTTILAARVSPVSAAKIEGFRLASKLLVSSPTDEMLDKITSTLKTVAEEVGDGCVSVESTKIAGIDDHVLVAGNHTTMLDQVGSKPGRLAAVDVILQRMKGDAENAREKETKDEQKRD